MKLHATVRVGVIVSGWFAELRFRRIGTRSRIGALPPHSSLPNTVVDFPLDKKYEDFNKLIAGGKEYDATLEAASEGRPPLCRNPAASIRPSQLLCPIAIARGMAMGGIHTLNFDEQVGAHVGHRVGDKVHLIRRNVHFQARSGPSPRHSKRPTPIRC